MRYAFLLMACFPIFLYAQAYFEASGQTVAFNLTSGAKAAWNSTVAIEHQQVGLPAVPVMAVYPNPTNTAVTIAVKGTSEKAMVSIYNVAGKKVRSLAFTHKASATISTGLGNGLYFARLMVNGRTVQTTRFLVVR